MADRTPPAKVGKLDEAGLADKVGTANARIIAGALQSIGYLLEQLPLLAARVKALEDKQSGGTGTGGTGDPGTGTGSGGTGTGSGGTGTGTGTGSGSGGTTTDEGATKPRPGTIYP